MTTSVSCAQPTCRRRTKNASGRCHDHPFPIRPEGKPPLSLPLDPEVPRAADEPSYAEYGDGTLEVIYGTAECPHREDGPAYTVFSPDGRSTERWFVNGQIHRVDAPAKISYLRDGSVEEEVWNARNMIHRLDGPAHLYYSRNGKSDISREYVLGNLAIGGIGVELERIGTEKAREAIELSPFATLLDEGHEVEQVVAAIGAGVRTPQGVREVINGTPAEWVVAYEEGQS